MRSKAVLRIRSRAVGVDTLVRLCATARSGHYSATGRPRWLQENGGAVRRAVLAVFGPDGPGVLRCVVTLELDTAEWRWFSLDVAARDLLALPADTATGPRSTSRLPPDHARHIPVEA